MYCCCGSLTARIPNGFSHFASSSFWADAELATAATARAATPRRNEKAMVLSIRLNFFKQAGALPYFAQTSSRNRHDRLPFRARAPGPGRHGRWAEEG